MGILINCGPIETGVKHLFSGVVWTMMSPGGSSMASLENIVGFLSVNTSPDDLIDTDFEQIGVVLEVMFNVFKEFIFLLGRHPLHDEVTRMVVCKVGKPWGRRVTTKRNHIECLERKCFIYFLFLGHILMRVF